MRTSLTCALLAAAVAAAPGLATASDAPGAEEIFKRRCMMCHKIDKGGMGPAVKKMITDETELRKVITDGRNMMPRFDKLLKPAEIEALVAYIRAQQ